jgi:hypothetical protein
MAGAAAMSTRETLRCVSLVIIKYSIRDIVVSISGIAYAFYYSSVWQFSPIWRCVVINCGTLILT